MASKSLSPEAEDLIRWANEKFPGPYLTAAQVGELLQIPKKTIEYYARTGQIPFEQYGRHKRFSPVALAHWKMEK